MLISFRELWTVIHGMILGAIYLIAFTGGFAELWSFRSPLITEAGVVRRLRRLNIGMWLLAAVAWATVVSGTYIVYPWYRAKIPESPRSFLLADPELAGWHRFGMEWKEHIGWLCPILATAVAFMITYYGKNLIRQSLLRKTLLVLFSLAFVSAGVAGVFGAFINKIAPIH